MESRGSISVFSALSLMLVAAVLFTLLEGCRSYEERKVLETSTDAALESVFAGFDLPMWEKYHLLMRSVGATEERLNLSELEQVFVEILEESLNPKAEPAHRRVNNYLRAELAGLAVKEYVLVTDGNGAAFQSAVASYMRRNVAMESLAGVKEIYDRQQSFDSVDVDEAVANARESLSNAAEESQEQSGDGESHGQSGDGESHGQSGDGESQEQSSDVSGIAGTDSGGSELGSTEVEDNPLEALIKLKDMGILALTLPRDADISEKSIDGAQLLSERTLEQGNGTVQEANGWQDKLLLQMYYARHFSDYLSPNTEGGLQYEREYLLGGKASDQSNLKSCVRKILAAREAANLIAVSSDERKRQEAESIATLLAGAAANPMIISAVTAGILAAWAYAESILDLRTLLAGGRIALVKNAEQWTSEVSRLSQCVSVDFRAVECEEGMNYSDFVNLLLYSASSGKTSLRAMDVMEKAIRAREGYENFRMDHMLLSASVEAEYHFSQNFLSLVVLKELSGTAFMISCESGYSYLKAGD